MEEASARKLGTNRMSSLFWKIVAVIYLSVALTVAGLWVTFLDYDSRIDLAIIIVFSAGASLWALAKIRK